jgi:N-acetylgalactosamine kinase
MAIDQDILLAVSKSDEERLVFSNLDSRYEEVSLDLTSSNGKIEVKGDSSKWWNYILCGIKGVIDEVVLEKLGAQSRPVGLLCLFDGTIPPSAGLSRYFLKS